MNQSEKGWRAVSIMPMLALALLFAGAARAADDPHNWNVLSVSESGTVTLLKGLTKAEADFTAARLQGLPATAAERKQEADDKAAAEEAARVAKLREDEHRRRILPPCPKEGEPDWMGDPVWKQFGEKAKDVAETPHSFVSGCHSKDGTVHVLSQSVSSDYYWHGFSLAHLEPWARDNKMKMVEVFQ